MGTSIGNRSKVTRLFDYERRATGLIGRAKRKNCLYWLRCIAKGAWGVCSVFCFGWGLDSDPGLLRSLPSLSISFLTRHNVFIPGFSQDMYGMALQLADLGAYANETRYREWPMGLALFRLYFLFCILSFLLCEFGHFVSLFHNFDFFLLCDL